MSETNFYAQYIKWLSYCSQDVFICGTTIILLVLKLFFTLWKSLHLINFRFYSTQCKSLSFNVRPVFPFYASASVCQQLMVCSFSWIMSFQCLISSCPLKFFPKENQPIISFFFLAFDIVITSIVKVTSCRSFSDISYMKLSLYSGSAMLFLMVVLLFATCLPDDDNKVTFTYVSVSEWEIVYVTYTVNMFVIYKWGAIDMSMLRI